MALIRRLPDDELTLLQPLFEAVFKHSVSSALLHWKYGEGRGESWLLESVDGQPMVHCGLFFRDVLAGGVGVRAAQLVDLMALPKTWGLSRMESPFAVLMRKILADLPRLGNPQGLAFGFPSERAMRLGEHIGVYRAVDCLMELEFAPIRRRLQPRLHVLGCLSGADAAKLDGLWRRMSGDLSEFAVGVRDAKYVQQRYLAHPDRRYTLLLVESLWRRTPVGLAVIAPGDDRRELLDVVCAWEDVSEVIAGAQHWLALNSGKALVFCLTERFAKQIASLAVRCDLTQFRIMGNPFSSAASLDWLKGRWWLTGGDTDYR